MRLLRSAVLTLALLLAACGGQPPVEHPPLTYDYLTKIKLDVGSIDIDDRWAPRGAAQHMEYAAPTAPRTALRQMAEDRLVPGGTTGRAVFVIDDASLIRVGHRYEGNFAVHIDLYDANEAKIGAASARVRGARAMTADDEDNAPDDLYALTRKLMDDMNVELEFQIRRAFRQKLQTTSPSAPAPDAVQTQDLDAPGTTTP